MPKGPTKLSGALRPEDTEARKHLRKLAGTLVAQTFYAPMMAQMRNSPFKDEKFSGGRGGEAFSQVLDQQIVSKMSRGHDPLVESIIKRFERIGAKAEGQDPGRLDRKEMSLADAAREAKADQYQGHATEGAEVAQ
jgi:Rod binding domain-containing protein